jgi:hypothetical protein
MAGFTVVVFAIGMLAITGIELVKGSPLNTSSSSTSQRPGARRWARCSAVAASTETSTRTRRRRRPSPRADERGDQLERATRTPARRAGTGFGADEERRLVDLSA